MKRQSQLIRSASLNGYSELAESLGLDTALQLRRVGLSRRSLKDTEALISAGSVGKLLENSAHAARIEDFGLRLAANRFLTNLGPISIVLKEEPTARQALDTLCRYLLLLNASLTTHIEDHENVVVIREELLHSSGVSVRQAIELAVGVMYRILNELIGRAWRPRNVCFTHRAPRDPSIHRAFFGVTVEFNASFNGIVCAARDMTAPLPKIESGMATYARRLLDEAASSIQPSMSNSVRRLIAVTLPGGRCTADQLSLRLRIDRRTLYRHLAQEGHTFSSLLQGVRYAMAQRLVEESDRSLIELAHLLGFSSASAFAYWFRQSFSCSVSRWRQRSVSHPR